VRRIWGGCCADCDCDRVRRLLSSLWKHVNTNSTIRT
jgi:hypothetical protein